jgi:uncharacterized SAM-binding protein YcdF (DUF218 family)
VFVFLSKLLPQFVYPLGLMCLLLALAALLARRRPRLTQTIIWLTLALVWVASNRWTAQTLARSLEWQYLPSGDLPNAQAIVVLGGGTASIDPPRPMVEINSAGQRLIYAADLYRRGKAPLILLSGGKIDWQVGETGAQDMAILMRFMGTPDSALILEADSLNTYENAVNTRRILGPLGVQRILLVTSALHMPRAVGLFRKQGFEVIPAPCNFDVTVNSWNNFTQGSLESRVLGLLPGVENLGLTTRSLKEYIGIWVYRLRGDL